MARILFFAGLREALGSAGESFSMPAGVDTVGRLREHLAARGGTWAEQFAPGRNVRAAVNQDMASPDTVVGEGDEIAFFPPVTGG
jgi:molybdopterin synthase sulfur carrier subunit